MSQKKEQFDDEWLDDFERDFVLRQIEAGRVKPQPAVLLEQQGWRDWLMTLFPFWFAEEFSADQAAFWELRWSVLQRYKQQMRIWGQFTDQEERTQHFIKIGIYVTPKEATAFEFWGRGIGKSATLEAARIMYGAVLSSGYSLMISETDDQAQEHLGNCRILIEHPDSKLVQYYPDMAITDNSDAVKNMPTADRKEMLICKNGWILRAKGLSAKMRGLRVGTQRPTEICLDDVDDVNDSLMVSLNKERVVTSSILPVLAKERLIIDFGQNLITDHSFATRLWNGKSDALSERTIFGVTNAFEKLDIDSFIDDTGKLRHTILPTSIPSWKGLNITAAQRFLNNSGLQTFLAEYQNEFDQFKSGKVIPEYDESVQIITWSDFERVFGEKRIPAHWQSIVGLDVGYTEGNYPHYSAWVFMTAAAQNSRYPGLQFVYRSRFFKKVSIDDQAEQIKQEMWPSENVYSWQMSHEKTGEMMTLNKQHQLPFYKFKYYKSEDGVAQWRHLSRPDKRYPHPFLPDDQLEDGTYSLGRPLLYYIVDDDQRIHARNDDGMMLLRQQISEWDYVPVKLTDSGQTVQKPSKVNDDGVDALRAIICYFGAVPTELNQAEKIQARMPETLRTADNDEDKQARGYWLQREAKRMERESQQKQSRGFGGLGDGLRNFEKMRRM